MKLAKTPIQKWMQYCFLSLLFLVVACNVSEPVIDEPPTATAISANDTTEDVTHTDDARTDVATTTRAALESALIARFTPEASFMAVAAALERGYAYPQLEAGILAQRLQENGWIQTEASSMLTPELEPAGVLDLSELSSITGRTRRFRLAAHAAAQNETVALTQFLAGIQNLSEPIATDEITTTDGDFRFTMIVIILGQTGYSLEQIVEALLFGMEFVANPSCGYLIDNDGTALVPAYNYKDPFDGTGCYVSTPAPSDDEAAEVDNETASDDAVETNEAGDVVAFCATYEQMVADMTAQVDAYAAAVSSPDCDYCGGGYLEAAEAVMEIAFDRMISDAPPEIRSATKYVAAQPLVNILSSPDGAPPELEAQMLVVDDYAVAHCAVSLQGSEE